MAGLAYRTLFCIFRYMLSGKTMKIKKLNISQLSTAAMILVMVLLIVNPSAKAFVMEGLMKAGLFQPNTEIRSAQTSTTVNDVSFLNEKGEQVRLSDLKGKVVFINFWATWCPPCIAEMPSINKLNNKFKSNKDFALLMVDVDNNQKRSANFLKRRRYELPLFTPASEIPGSFLSGSIPTTVVLDKQGKMVFRHEGAADYTNKDFMKFITGLLQ